ncbi:MAG TPA: hypothetical protein VGA37_13210 [Gemmatimonadales bacterium]
MALVRCEKHNIPYNDANPRGCPACWQETSDDRGGVEMMRQLARASRGLPEVEVLPRETAPETAPGGLARASWPPPVTTPPRLPTRPLTRFERTWNWIVAHRSAVGSGIVLTVVLSLIYVITRPTFEEGYDPPFLADDARPFPVQLNIPIDAVFAIFGTAPPELNPDSPALARYRFGPGTFVDAYNGAVYAVTLTTIERSWRGNRVGLSEPLVEGRLALLGAIERPRSAASAPFPVGDHLVYARRNDRPVRTLVTRVRPPNGCFDVFVDLAPRAIGQVTRGEEAFVAVARRGGTMEWVSVQVRAVTRAIPGPYAGPPECES